MQESGEMYLESILVLSQKDAPVRSMDVAKYLGVSKPSVSRAMGILRDGGFIRIAEDGNILLTDAGSAVAERIYERHRVLTQWLTDIGVPEDVAAADACKLEHDISAESFECLKSHLRKAHPNVQTD